MNRVTLMGRLTRNPEMIISQKTGTAICRFTVAINRRFKKDETDFINCVAFGKRAETINKYIVKGNQILLNGNIRTGSYTAQDGTKRYTTDIIVENFEFIGTKNNNNNNSNNNNSNNNNNNWSRQNNNTNNNWGKQNNNTNNWGNDDDFIPVDDGDMPF